MAQSYEKAGVNLEAGYEVVRRIKKHVASTSRLGVMGNIGAFGGMFDLAALKVQEPVLVSGTDGVGTKLKLAFLMDKHEPDYILGSLSFSHISRGSSPSANMGYKIDEYHRNEGLASLMIATALEDIVPDIGLHRTECYIHPDNSTSLHLMEKFGFIDEGIAHSYVRLNGIWQDHRRFVYIS